LAAGPIWFIALFAALSPRLGRHRYLFSAKGAPSLAAWGTALGRPDISNPPALKARLIAVVDNMKSDEKHPAF
jgi:hypothetical protein